MDNTESKKINKIVRFRLEEPRYAIYLSEIERVIQAIEIIPLPKAPQKILGIINIHGEIIPVIDVRSIFRLPRRALHIDDQFIIANTKKRRVALVVDEVLSVTELKNSTSSNTLNELHYADYLSGVAVIDNDVVLINNLEKFLSLEDHKLLDEAIIGK